MWKCKNCGSTNIKGTSLLKCKANVQVPKDEFFVGYKIDNIHTTEDDGIDCWECLDCGEHKKNLDLRDWAEWEDDE